MRNLRVKSLQAGWRLTTERHHFIGTEQTHHFQSRLWKGKKPLTSRLKKFLVAGRHHSNSKSYVQMRNVEKTINHGSSNVKM